MATGQHRPLPVDDQPRTLVRRIVVGEQVADHAPGEGNPLRVGDLVMVELVAGLEAEGGEAARVCGERRVTARRQLRIGEGRKVPGGVHG